MINLQYHPELLEQAVWLAARRDAMTEHRLHASVDPLYELPPGDLRDEQFRTAFRNWFTRLKLDRLLDEVLVHFEHVVERIGVGLVRAARQRKSQGAELYVGGDTTNPRRTLIIQLCPESLVEPESIRDTMLRELQHVEDMLDETFGYVPESIDGLPPHQQVVRDRYRILWNIRVEAILNRRGLLASPAQPRLRSLFDRAFTLAGEAPCPTVFESIWQQAGGSHAQMFAWADDPRNRLFQNPEVRQTDIGGLLGAPCPLCRFPTFDWYDWSKGLGERIETSVRESLPTWRRSDGLCRQCAETLVDGPFINKRGREHAQ